MKPLFQRQCEALVKTLTEAKANERIILDMGAWVSNLRHCGTAACVCGYQALTNDLNLFQRAKGRLFESQNYDDIATSLSGDLERSCYSLFSDSYLAKSIYLGDAENRFISARDAEVADEKKLRTFKHLTSENTSLDDAIKYIEFVIEKCEEQSA